MESFSDVVYLARIPDLLLDQGSKKSSSLSLFLDSSSDKEDAYQKEENIPHLPQEKLAKIPQSLSMMHDVYKPFLSWTLKQNLVQTAL